MNIRQSKALVRYLLTTSLSPNAIAAQRGMSHHTVRRYLQIAKCLDLTTEQLAKMSDTDFARLFRARGRTAKLLALPDWADEITLIGQGYSRFEAHCRYVARVGEALAMAYRTYCLKLGVYPLQLDPPDHCLHFQHAPIGADAFMDPAKTRWALTVINSVPTFAVTLERPHP